MKSLPLFLIALLGLALAGCGPSDLGSTTVPPQKPEDQIAKVQADTHMPQQAKDAQIAQIKARAEQGKAMDEAAKAGHRPGGQ